MVYLTRAQRVSLLRKYKQDKDGARSYREFRQRVQSGWDCVMLKWCGMYVGIEPDGYTHT